MKQFSSPLSADVRKLSVALTKKREILPHPLDSVWKYTIKMHLKAHFWLPSTSRLNVLTSVNKSFKIQALIQMQNEKKTTIQTHVLACACVCVYSQIMHNTVFWFQLKNVFKPL